MDFIAWQLIGCGLFCGCFKMADALTCLEQLNVVSAYTYLRMARFQPTEDIVIRNNNISLKILFF